MKYFLILYFFKFRWLVCLKHNNVTRFLEHSGFQIFFPIVTISKLCQTICCLGIPGEGVWAEIVNAMNTGGLNQVHGIAHFWKSSKQSLYLSDYISSVNLSLQMKSIYEILTCSLFTCPTPLPSIPYNNNLEAWCYRVNCSWYIGCVKALKVKAFWIHSHDTEKIWSGPVEFLHCCDEHIININ